MSDPFDPDTLAFYARDAADYAARRPLAGRHHLEPFLDRLAPGARVLELGCGAGKDAAHIIARGFDLDPTDAVPELAAHAAARIGRPIRIMRFDELEAQADYDAVWANASLHHAPFAELPGILARIHRALKPGGWHFANYKGDDGKHGGGGRDFLGRYYSYPSQTQLADAYESAGPWAETIIEPFEDGTYGGGLIPWFAVTVQKAI